MIDSSDGSWKTYFRSGKSIARTFLNKVSAAKWRWKNSNYLFVFTFHQVSPEFRPGIDGQAIWSSTKDFERQLDFILGAFRLIRLDEGIERLRRNEPLGRCAAITFDDGDLSMERYCVPILQRMQAPATFFINTAHLEGSGHYWYSILNYLQNAPPHIARQCSPQEIDGLIYSLRTTSDPAVYDLSRQRVARLAERESIPERECVSTEWLSKLNGALFSIGAHGHTHERYAMMTDEWQNRDLKLNLDYLTQFKSFRPIFAFPFGKTGDCSEATLQAAAKHGLAVWGSEGGVNLSLEPVGRRIPADGCELAKAVVKSMASA